MSEGNRRIPEIVKHSEPQLSGRPGRKWWRVRYWLRGETKPRSKYLGPAEGDRALTQQEARIQILSVLRDVVDEAIRQLDLPIQQPAPVIDQAATIPTLKEHIDDYMRRREKRYSGNTMKSLRETARYMLAAFGPDTRLDAITRKAVDDWFDSMVSGEFADRLEQFEGKPNKCNRKGLSDGTIKPHISNARHIFSEAVKRYPDHLRANPFDHIKIRVQPSKGDWKYVPQEDVIKVMEAATDVKTSRIGWQVLLALCRFAGLRKGEAFDLKKSDVNLESDPPLIKVYSSKTARMSGNPSRVVPVLFPILEGKLREAMRSNPDDPHVVSTRLPRSSGSDHKTLKRIARRAGVRMWRPAFQVLRACCEKDFLLLGLSERCYTQAIGHSPEVSRKWYLARFQDADIDEVDRDEFKQAASRVKAEME